MILDEKLRNQISSIFLLGFIFILVILIVLSLNRINCYCIIGFFSSDMMLLHGYQHQGASLGVPTSHSSTSYLQNLGPSRPLYKSGKDDALISVSGGPPIPSLYGQSISLIPSLNYQGQSNAKRSRSPSPPPQLYHAFKPHNLSSYNSSKFK